MKLLIKELKFICKSVKEDYLSHEFLDRGNHNELFLLKTKNKSLVLKIQNNSMYNTTYKEYSFLKKTNGKFGPKVYFYGTINKKRCFLMDFIDGEHPKKKSKDFIIKMGSWYKFLAKDKSLKKTRYHDENGAFSLERNLKFHGYNDYLKTRKVLEIKLRNKINLMFEDFIKICKTNNSLFSRQKFLYLNQGDPSRKNIFFTEKGIKLIDWEFVRYDLREQDLVFFIWSYKLNNFEKELFLEKAGYKGNMLKIDIILKLHFLSMISWLIGRLAKVKAGEIDINQQRSNEKEIIKEIKKQIKKFKVLE